MNWLAGPAGFVGVPLEFRWRAFMPRVSRPAYLFGSYRLDAEDGSPTLEGEPVPLPPKAIDVLLVLVEEAGNVVSKADLTRRAWSEEFLRTRQPEVQIFLIREQFRSRDPTDSDRNRSQAAPRASAAVKTLPVESKRTGGECRPESGSSAARRQSARPSVEACAAGLALGVLLLGLQVTRCAAFAQSQWLP